MSAGAGARALVLAICFASACREREPAREEPQRAAGWYEREQRTRASAALQRASAAARASASAERSASATPWVPASNDEGDFVLQQLNLRAAGLPEGMVPVLGPLRTTLDSEASEHSFTVRPGHCYRVLVVGGVDTGALALVLRDPTGLELDRDASSEPWASLGERRPWCPAIAGNYRVEVRGHAASSYGIGVYGTR